MKAIETRYAGCRFRSRLEARWAVFFDALRIRWEYEPEGYKLPSGPYLPDFWLPDVFARGRHRGVWLEVKPNIPDDDPRARDPRWSQMYDATGKALYVAFGLPQSLTHGSDDPSGRIEEFYSGWDNCMTFCDCQRDFNHYSIMSMEYGPESNYHNGDHYDINCALVAARSARFEHGESG